MSAIDRIAHRTYERQAAQNDPTREWDEPALKPDRFRSAFALRNYHEMTDFKVTSETFAKEERRKNMNIPGDHPRMPPPGLTCSARLGAVSTLL